MVASDRSPLAGLVEIDETEIVCRSKNDPLTGGGGRSHQGKILMVGAVEVGDGGPGRIRLQQVSDYSAKALVGFWGDGGTSHDESRDEDAKESFAPAPGVVHELEEAEIQRQLLLRDAPVWPQPGA